MIVQPDEDLYVHQKICHFLSDGPDGECDCCLQEISAGEKICIVDTQAGISFFATSEGKVFCVRTTWWTLLCWKANSMRLKDIREWNGEDCMIAMLLVCVLFLVTACCISIVNIIKADGKISHCVVKDSVSMEAGETYVIVGYRPWRENVILYHSSSRDDVDKKAAEICPK